MIIDCGFFRQWLRPSACSVDHRDPLWRLWGIVSPWELTAFSFLLTWDVAHGLLWFSGCNLNLSALSALYPQMQFGTCVGVCILTGHGIRPSHWSPPPTSRHLQPLRGKFSPPSRFEGSRWALWSSLPCRWGINVVCRIYSSNTLVFTCLCIRCFAPTPYTRSNTEYGVSTSGLGSRHITF